MATLELPDVIMRLVKSYQKHHVYTAMPGTVIGVAEYEGQQVIDVDPAINDIYEDDQEVLELPIVQEVPVVWPSAGDGLLSFPIKKGDPVLLLFSQRSISEWLDRRKFGKYTPSDNRNFHLTDAIAVPGLYSKVNNLGPSSTDVELKFKDDMSLRMTPDNKIILTNSKGTITFDDSGNVTVVNDGNLQATVGGTTTLDSTGDVTINSPTIKLNGDVEITGSSVTHNGTNIGDDHVHGGVSSGTAKTDGPE